MTALLVLLLVMKFCCDPPFQCSSHTSSPLRFNKTQLGQQRARAPAYSSYVKAASAPLEVFTAL